MSSRRKTGSALLVLLALLLLWLAVLVTAPWVGSQSLSPAQLLSGDAAAVLIFSQIRLPRVLMAMAVGGALTLAGVGFQTLFRNPMAEPYTLGVSSGAALGAVLAMQFGGAGGFPLVVGASFLGALSVTGLVLGLAWRGSGLETRAVLLAGIAVALSCSALILFVQYLSDLTKTFRMVRWMMGGLGVVGYREVIWVALWSLAGAVLLFAYRREFNLLLAGEEVAASRGVNLSKLRLLVLGTISLMVGALVAVAGPIGFVGLIVPHILRSFIGHDHAFLLPAAFLGGGAFLALCDLGARTVMAPAELPVGIITALLGGPFFLWVLLRQGRVT